MSGVSGEGHLLPDELRTYTTARRGEASPGATKAARSLRGGSPFGSGTIRGHWSAVPRDTRPIQHSLRQPAAGLSHQMVVGGFTVVLKANGHILDRRCQTGSGDMASFDREEEQTLRY